MYIDGVVAFGLVIVVLSCVMITYVGIYAYKHIQADTENAKKKAQAK